jgi:hypothetical protein
MKIKGALDICFYVVCRSLFAQQAGNIIFPSPQFMILYKDVYVYMNQFLNKRFPNNWIGKGDHQDHQT